MRQDILQTEALLLLLRPPRLMPILSSCQLHVQTKPALRCASPGRLLCCLCASLTWVHLRHGRAESCWRRSVTDGAGGGVQLHRANTNGKGCSCRLQGSLEVTGKQV